MIREWDNGLPFPEQVKDGRDRMYNDLLGLMREMGVSWKAATVYGTPGVSPLSMVLRFLRSCVAVFGMWMAIMTQSQKRHQSVENCCP